VNNEAGVDVHPSGNLADGGTLDSFRNDHLIEIFKNFRLAGFGGLIFTHGQWQVNKINRMFNS